MRSQMDNRGRQSLILPFIALGVALAVWLFLPPSRMTAIASHEQFCVDCCWLNYGSCGGGGGDGGGGSPPLEITLEKQYFNLVYYGPRVGEPAQRLFGLAKGGSGSSYKITLIITRPDGSSYELKSNSSGSFSFGPAETGDEYFGTTQRGQWSAQAEVEQDGQIAKSQTVQWWVRWYPVNERP